MLRLTLDAFSGRENPAWLLPALPVLPVLRRIASELNFVMSPEAVPPVLGYRGLNLEILSPELRYRFNLPGWLSLVPGVGSLAQHVEQVLQLVAAAASLGTVPGGGDFRGLMRLIERLLAALFSSGGSGTPGPARPMGPCAFETLPVPTPASGMTPRTSGGTTVTPMRPTGGPTRSRSLVAPAAVR